jgi:multicomponent Na+:H+ antiporter subunit G
MMAMFLDAVSWFFLVVGSLFCVLGGVGILRLPELYSRTHAATLTDTVGAGFVLTGLMFQIEPGQILVLLKLILVLLLLLITSPTAGHALVKAAFARGVTATVIETGDSEAREDADADPD